MPNQLNKNKNKLKEMDEIRTTQGNLILGQQAERRRRFQKIADGRKSTEELLEETRQQVELVEEAREEFLNVYSPREENPYGRESTRTAQSVEGARAWSELFIRDTLPKWTNSLNKDPSSPKSTAARIQSIGVGIQSVGAGVQSIGVGIQSVGVGIQSVGVGIQSVGVGIQSVGARVQKVGVAVPNSALTQHPVIMAGPKEKLSQFDGDGAADPIRHCKKCEMIWRENGIINTNEWVWQFPATLRGVAIDWFADTDPQKLNNWDNIKKEFITEFQLLHDNNKIVVEIYNTKQGKNKTVQVYARKLKDLINKMENKPANGLQKRWFIEGLHPKLWKKIKIVPPSSYTEA